MKNLICVDLHSDFWIQVLFHLQKQYKWKPVYWVDGYLQREKVLLKFPNIVFHENSHALVGISAISDETQLVPLDTKILKSLQPYEANALKMLNRVDPYNYMTYDERKKYYLYYVRYWLTIIENMNIEMFIAPAMSHRSFEYILYAVCQVRQIPY